MPRRADSDNRIAGHDYEALMRHALRATEQTWPHPNPRVGAVVVNPDGTPAVTRAHVAPGQPHAEVLALDAVGNAARDATLVVTLEPCDHHGRTPPCTQAIIDAGIARVVVAALDPDPRVSGSGVARLRKAGIEVITGVGVADVVGNDPGYFHHRKTGMPRVVLKLAATLDGQLAAADGSSQWITGHEARREVLGLRAAADAVAVGGGSMRDDDPARSVRLDGYEGPQPRPIVIAGSQPFPADRRLLARRPLIYGPSQLDAPDGAEFVSVSGDGLVDLRDVLKDLGSRGVLDLLVEGGSKLAAGFAAAGLVDEYVIYLAGKLAAGIGRPMFDGVFSTLSAAFDLDLVDVAMVGRDLRIRAVPMREGV